MDALRSHDLLTVGIIANRSQDQQPAIVDARDIRVGFLAYAATNWATATSPGTAPLERERILREVAALQPQVDHVCVSLHHGFEYAPHPGYRAYRHYQGLLAAGVDVVFGHHPYVPQGIITSQVGSVAYCSLGNFVSSKHNPDEKVLSLQRVLKEGNPFARRYYDRVQVGQLGEVAFDGSRVVDHRAKVVEIKGNYAPRLIPERREGSPSVPPPSSTGVLATELKYYSSRLARQPNKMGGRFVKKFMRKIGVYQ